MVKSKNYFTNKVKRNKNIILLYESATSILLKKKLISCSSTLCCIILYNTIQSLLLKNYIFLQKIYKSLLKLSLNVIHQIRTYYFDVPLLDVQRDVVRFLVSKLGNYAYLKGKAFSYLNTVARNYLIQLNNNNYKRLVTHRKILSVYTLLQSSSLVMCRLFLKYESQSVYSKKIKLFIEYTKLNLDIYFKKQEELDSVNAILNYILNKDNYINFNNTKEVNAIFRKLINPKVNLSKLTIKFKKILKNIV